MDTAAANQTPPSTAATTRTLDHCDPDITMSPAAMCPARTPAHTRIYITPTPTLAPPSPLPPPSATRAPPSPRNDTPLQLTGSTPTKRDPRLQHFCVGMVALARTVGLQHRREKRLASSTSPGASTPRDRRRPALEIRASQSAAASNNFALRSPPCYSYTYSCIANFFTACPLPPHLPPDPHPSRRTLSLRHTHRFISTITRASCRLVTCRLLVTFGT